MLQHVSILKSPYFLFLKGMFRVKYRLSYLHHLSQAVGYRREQFQLVSLLFVKKKALTEMEVCGVGLSRYQIVFSEILKERMQACYI